MSIQKKDLGTNYLVNMKDGRKMYIYNAEVKVAKGKPFANGFFSSHHEAGIWVDSSHIESVEDRGAAKFIHPCFKAVNR